MAMGLTKEDTKFLKEIQEKRNIEKNVTNNNQENSSNNNNNNQNNNNSNNETTSKITDTPNQSGTYRNPLRKIFGGRVMQYPIDLNTDLQDYFEIQIFKYRPAKSLPTITESNQVGFADGGYASGSTQRGNRQNFRLQDLQATIQLPMPPSIKDMNMVDWSSGAMSGLAASVMGPAIKALLGQSENRDAFVREVSDGNFKGMRQFAANLMAFTSGTQDAIKGSFTNFFKDIQQMDFRRYQFVNAISQAVSGLGINIEVDQAITRVSGAVRNPNLELLFKGPALRNFSFTIRVTPRDLEESKRVRMIIRALKQHSAAKVNPQLFEGKTSRDGSNYLLGSPDVFKLRYIKARTQKDIKGLNKFKTCALNSISVDYTGEVGRFAAYEEDSQPVTTIIQLSFTELAPIYDKDYEEFKYTDDDVGM